MLRHRGTTGEQYDDFMALAETPQFNGQVINALAMDPNLAEKSGQTLITAELALEYGIADTRWPATALTTASISASRANPTPRPAVI